MEKESKKKAPRAKAKKTDLRTPIKMLKGSKRYMLIAIFAMIMGAIISYIIPYISSFAVDYVIGNEGNAENLPAVIMNWVNKLGGRQFFVKSFYVLPLLIVAFTIINGCFTFLRGRNIAKTAEGFSYNMRNALYKHLQEVPYDYHKHCSTGDLIQRCTSDVDMVRRFISTQLLEVFRTITMVVVACYIMFSQNITMALASVATLPILCFASYIYFKYAKKQFSLSDEAEGKLSAVLQENFSGVRVLRAFALQNSEVEKFTKCNRDFYNKTYKLISMMGVFWGGTDALGYIQILTTLSVGIFMAVKSDLTIGQLMMFTTYSTMLTWPVRQLGRVLADMGKATVSIGRLNEILDAPIEKEPGKALCTDVFGDIEFSHVCFGYDTKDDVLSDISFTAKKGQTIAILGSTGSGKTSLVQLLQRLYTVTDGSITVNGTNINDIEMHHLRENIGIVLQEPFLYSRSIMDNIKITNPSAADEEVFEAARVASVHNVITEFEKGYDTIVGEKGVTLSGGQKQRVAIARTLMRKSPILIFDDSLSAVDTETDLAIRKALAKQKGSATTFIISHRITTLCNADKILVLEHGKLMQQGTHEELMAQKGLYSTVAAIQNMTDEELLKGSELN